MAISEALRRRSKIEEVWIVHQSEATNHAILGVFATEQEADAFAAEVEDQYADSLVYAPFTIGYRYDTKTPMPASLESSS